MIPNNELREGSTPEPAMSLARASAPLRGQESEQGAKKNILVIKHGALGDFILATAAMKAIREHHPNDKITLLTTRSFTEMGRNSGYFDDVMLDKRPKLWQPFRILKLRKRLRKHNFDRVYDLQTSGRSGRYYHLFPMGKKPEWVGIVKKGSHYQSNPERKKMHTLERQRDQMKVAGIEVSGLPDISWLHSDVSRFALPDKYALIVAGCSPKHLEKRWTKHGIIEFARFLAAKNITPVFIGTKAEEAFIDQIASEVRGSINIASQTSVPNIAELGRGAALAAGSDTGPIHLLAASGCPTLIWFSRGSNPALCAPKGPNVRIIRKENLKNLDAKEAIGLANTMINQ